VMTPSLLAGLGTCWVSSVEISLAAIFDMHCLSTSILIGSPHTVGGCLRIFLGDDDERERAVFLVLLTLRMAGLLNVWMTLMNTRDALVYPSRRRSMIMRISRGVVVVFPIPGFPTAQTL
jgi:uncharacterized membrane protein YczE